MLELDFENYSAEQVLSQLEAKKNAFEDWQLEVYQFLEEWVSPKDFIVVNTSGSTGQAKSIQHLKTFVRNSALATGSFFGFEKGQTALLCMRATFVGGKMMVVRALEFKMHLLVQEAQANPFTKLKEPIHFVALVPLQLQTAIRDKSEFSFLSNVLVGGAAIDAGLEAQLQFLPSQFYSSYGMTETISHIALRALNGENKSEWYTVFDGVYLQADERSCLVINAPLLSNTLLFTNDLVEFKDDLNREFKILGRIDDVINSGGVKIYPAQIEQAVKEIMPLNCLVCGIPDEQLGEKVILVLESNVFETNELLNQLKKVLPKYQTPKAIYFLPEFYKTGSGKLDKQACKEFILRQLG